MADLKELQYKQKLKDSIYYVEEVEKKVVKPKMGKEDYSFSYIYFIF